MARIGRFSSARRRTGSNLTALIASLLREQRAAEDRAIFDAYQNGGEYKGQKVTDQRILDYIKGRRDSFSKDDASWDQWNNRLIQQEFAIGEQKVGLAYKQGKASASTVASFYKSQLGKIPKDSEFYRTVAGRAADWAKAAAGAARAAGRARAGRILQAKIDAAQQPYADHQALEAFLTTQAQRAGIIEGNQVLTDADASDLERFLNNSGLRFNGQAVSYDSWQKATVAAYGAFDKVIALQKAAGGPTKELQNNKAKFFNQEVVRVNAIDDRSKYEMAKDQYAAEIADAHGDPLTSIEVTKRYIATLSAIRDSALKSGGSTTNDPQVIGGIANEIEALTTGKASGPTVEDIYAVHGEGVSNTSDADNRAADAFTWTQQAQKIVSGTAYFGQDKPGGELQVIDYPPAAALDPNGTGLPPGRVMSLASINGVTRQVALQGTEVKSAVLVDSDNVPVNLSDFRTREQLQIAIRNGDVSFSKNGQTAGWVFTNPVSGQTTYGVTQPDGSLVYTKQNPFSNLQTIPGEGSAGVLAVIVGRENATLDANHNAVANPGAGILPLAINGQGSLTFNGQTGLSATVGADSLLVDSSVTVADMERMLGGDARYTDLLANKRREVEQDKQNRLEDARFISDLRSGPNAMPRASVALNQFAQNVPAQSPLGGLISQATEGIGNVLKGLTTTSAPPPLNTSRTKDDVFRAPSLPPPPPPPSSDRSLIAQAEGNPFADAAAAHEASQLEATAMTNASVGWEPNDSYVPPPNANRKQKYL